MTHNICYVPVELHTDRHFLPRLPILLEYSNNLKNYIHPSFFPTVTYFCSNIPTIWSWTKMGIAVRHDHVPTMKSSHENFRQPKINDVFVRFVLYCSYQLSSPPDETKPPATNCLGIILIAATMNSKGKYTSFCANKTLL